MQRRGTRRRRRRVTDEQIALLPGDPEHGWWRCHGIFTPSYLTQHLLPGDDVPAEDQVAELYEFVKALWLQKLPGMRRRPEPFTRSEFLDPVLARLGWELIPEESLPDTQTRKRPDYCLFGDAQTKARVEARRGYYRLSDGDTGCGSLEHSTLLRFRLRGRIGISTEPRANDSPNRNSAYVPARSAVLTRAIPVVLRVKQ